MSKANKSRALGYLKVLGDNATIVSDGTVYDSVEYIDTGCYLLNAQLSNTIYGGIRSNKITGLAGEESTGKTFLLLGLVKNYLEMNKDAMVVFFESEGAVDKYTFESRGIDTTRVILKTVESVEDLRHRSTVFLNAYKADTTKDRPKIMMCLDSLGMLPSDKESDDAQEGKNKADMTRAKVIKSLFRIITIKLALANIPLIFTNHVYDVMDQYSLPEFSGGKGSKFSASTLLYLAKSNFKDTDAQTHAEEHSGITVTSHTVKSRDTRQKTKVKFVIHVKHGLDKFSGMFEFCKDFGLLEKIGNRYFWASEGDDDPKYKKAILADPASFFTKSRLDDVDATCREYFGYGDALDDKADLKDELSITEAIELDKGSKPPRPKKSKSEKSKK